MKRPKPPNLWYQRPSCISMLDTTSVSVDTLTDREGIFVTMERPAFRGKEEPPKTLNVNHIIVATGFHKENKDFLQGMRLAFQETRTGVLSKSGKHPEPGLYTLGNTGLAKNDRYEIPQIIEQIPLLEKNILSFFSRVS